MKKLTLPDYFGLIKQLPLNLKDKKTEEYISMLQVVVKEFEYILNEATYILSPNQNVGVEVARASFNYYTVDKTNKDFDSIYAQKLKELKQPYQLNTLQINFLKEIGFDKYLTSTSVGTTSSSVLRNIGINELYAELKAFKSLQKNQFIEALKSRQWRKQLSSGVLNEEESLVKAYVKDNYPLFNDKGGEAAFNFYKLLTSIRNLGDEKNIAKQTHNYNKLHALDRELRSQRLKMGRYFKYEFKRYSDIYCNNIYKRVAMSNGKITADIRAVESEKIEAKLLNYWSHFLVQGNQKYLVLVPKNQMQGFKKFLSSKPVGSEGGSTIITLHSLTLRALDKLLRKNYPRELSSKGNIPFIKDEDKIKVYKDVLKGSYSRLHVNTSYFKNDLEDLVSSTYNTIEEFRIALERVSYKTEVRLLQPTDVDYIKKQFGVIVAKITSYDLERGYSGDKKDHTKIWDSFWAQKNWLGGYPVRINPELRIFYRNKLPQEDQRKQKNRFSKPIYRVSFTVTQNAANKEINTSFSTEKDLVSKITSFNKDVVGEFIRKQGKGLYYFGIDRGTTELATLGVVRWCKEGYEAALISGEVKHFPKPEFPDITVFSIKDMSATKELVSDKKGNKVTIKISENPSYFMSNEKDIKKHFLRKKVSFIDLTTAKVIKGNIVLNGDTKTYINLKKSNASRKLYEVYSKIDPVAKIEFVDNAFIVKLKPTEHYPYQILCYYFPQQELVVSKTEMLNYLQDYLEKLRLDSSFQQVSIDSINNLRDAVSANIVGVVAFLFKKYPAIINLENLHKEELINHHFNKNNESIARRLEWALYRKFQKEGLVPPNLKQTIFLREGSDVTMHNFGIIHFVPPENTSSKCPYCGESTSMKNRKEDKFNDHSYFCKANPNCGFNTKNPKYPLNKITNSDSVAAYNIASTPYVL